MKCRFFACAVFFVSATALRAGSLDIVLLVENTTTLETDLTSITRGFTPGDRVALLSFAKNSRRQVAFTDDLARVARRISRMGHGGHGSFGAPWDRTGTTPRVLRAIVEACAQFDSPSAAAGRKRIVVVIFASDDYSARPGPVEVATTLSKRGARLYAVAVRRWDPKLGDRDRVIVDPPPRMRWNLAPPPDLTLKTLGHIAVTVGGEAISAKHDLSHVLDNARK